MNCIDTVINKKNKKNILIMSINIFGSSSKKQSSDNVDKKYVNQKFITLSANLATKVDKSGDTLSGNLYLSVNNDKERSFGVIDISDGKSVLFMLGDVNHKIQYIYGHPMILSSNNGYKFTNACGDICDLGNNNDTKSYFHNDIVMNDKLISDLCNPKTNKDAANKYYVDSKWIKSNVGYVPNLSSNTNKNGFIVSASSEYHDAEAYKVFNDDNDSNWITANNINTDFWIQIQCPERIRIYKIKLRGLKLRGRNGIINDKVLFNWKWQGSNDGTNWISIYEDNNSMIGYEILDVLVNCSLPYSYYRIFVNKAETDNPGLSYCQLYPICTVLKK
jgi:hypothetical protein